MSSVTFTTPSPALETGSQRTMASDISSGYGTSVANSFGGASGPGKTPFRHIDDLVSVRIDLDTHTPLRRILELGDAHMRQAITYHDFRRPDLALQEYIKAFTIAVDTVPKHKDYPSLKSDRGDLNRLYSALKSKITNNGAIFDKIKEDIKEDNRRSGVQPTAPPKASDLGPSQSSPQTRIDIATHLGKDWSQNGLHGSDVGSMANGGSQNANSATHKPKPTIQPKPQALQGKAIKEPSKASQDDLANRFARLRDARGLGQNSKTAEQSRTAAPGEPSVLHQPLASAMPKLPEAIYNPARGTVTSEVANLPSSIPRGMFSRTNSMASAPTVSPRVTKDYAVGAVGREQFVTAHAYQAPEPSSTPGGVRIPVGDTISAKALEGLINQNQDSPQIEVLIIDVRDRESFEEGHIGSSRTICVEPEILMRENISADEIADSMVLAPSNERLAMEQRDKVDLVVIYDQDSTLMPTRITGDPLDMVLYNLRQALSYYSYRRPLKDSPKLLKGGLNSWLDEFGDQSLKVSDTSSSDPRHLGASSARISKSGRRRVRAKARTLSREEVRRFEDMIRQDQDDISAFDYVRSRNDFMRRYPSIAGAPESMSSPVENLDGTEGALDSQGEEYLADVGPIPPRRPAPAMPRTRYSGLDSREDDSNIGAIAKFAMPASSRRIISGLDNPGSNSCFCNSALQALFHSPGFRQEILAENWPEHWRRHTTIEPTRPQLMALILKNLFYWLNRNMFPALTPRTLLNYIRSIHTGYQTARGITVRLGDGNQHDVDEMLTFVFGQLSAETNITDTLQVGRQLRQLRTQARTAAGINSPEPRTVDDVAKEDELLRGGHAVAVLYLRCLNNYRPVSFLDRHFGITEADELTCTACNQSRFIEASNQGLWVTPDITRTVNRPDQLENMVGRDWNPQAIDYNCERPDCPRKGLSGKNGGLRRHYIVSAPRLLRVGIRRAVAEDPSNPDNKSFTPVRFPMVFDLSNYTIGSRAEAATLLSERHQDNFLKDPIYDLYAIVVHIGLTAVSGHYVTYVRHERGWIYCDDRHCALLQGPQWDSRLHTLYQCINQTTPVQLFYKRKDIPFVYEI
ncbi:cysteine proteinase [Hypoxylon sp. NC1633]|nr:cysteine proteinase [Hypoxylon sp. NC1633]